MPSIGFLTLRDDGIYEGELSTLTVTRPLALIPVESKGAQEDADYIIASGDIELGFGWKKISQDTKREYVTLSLATPEFGCKPLSANLGLAKGEPENRFTVYWNPDP